MTDKVASPPKTYPLWVHILVGLLALGLLITVVCLIPDYAVDFTYFYEAGTALRSGQSPYTVPGYYSPVWVAALFTPLTFFTRAIAYRIYAALLLGGYIFILWRLSHQQMATLLLAIFAPFVYMSMQYGNIEWLVLLGLLLPKPLGLWLVLAKPQMGFTLALVWAWQVYREHGLKALLQTFLPITLGFGLSVLWGMRLPDRASLLSWSADVWPYGLLLGIPFFIYAFRKKDDYWALAAAPFLTPYLNPMSWAAVLPVSMRSPRRMLVAFVLTWVMVILWRAKI